MRAFYRVNSKIGLCLAALCIAGGSMWWLVDPSRDEPVQLRSPVPFGTIWLDQRKDAAQVKIQLIYPYGEHANPYEEGLAHYVEHLAWQNMVDDDTQNGRHSNAWTSSHVTAYTLTVEPNSVQDALNRMATTAEPLRVSQADALKERHIVEREYDLRVAEDRLKSVREEMAEALYGESGFGRQIMGTPDSIATFTLDRASQLHSQTHILEAATLLISGPVSPAYLRRVLKDIPPEVTDTVVPTKESHSSNLTPLRDTRSISVEGVRDRILLRRLALRIPTGMTQAKLAALLELTHEMMTGTKSSGLIKPLKYDQFIARALSFNIYELGEDRLEVQISAIPDSDVSLDALLNALDAAIANAAQPSAHVDFESIHRHELASIAREDDILDENTDRIFEAAAMNLPYVPFADYAAAMQALSFEDYVAFQDHIASAPRQITRLIHITSKPE